MALSAVLLGVLAACGQTEPVGAEAREAPRASEALPFDVEEVVQRARAELPGARATSAAAPTVSAEIAVPGGYLPSFVRHIMPAVAAGNGLYLVVFTQVRTDVTPSLVDLYGVRVRASDGALLDSTPFLIAGGSGDQVYPSVAFDGSNFLVVWNTPPLVYGLRVRASDGAVLDAPLLLSNPGTSPYGMPLPHMNPAVSFDGTHYLVVWNGTFYSDNALRSGILGSWVRPSDGQLVDPLSFVIASRQGSRPRVATGGGRHLVVWSDVYNSETPNVYGVRIDAASRQVLDTTPLPIITTLSYGEESPEVASDGSDFLVVWRLSGSGQLQQRRMSASTGAALDIPSPLAEASALPASVTFDGRDYRVTWQGLREGVMQVFSTRVPSGGGAGAELLLSSIESTSQGELPGIAATAEGHFLSLYTQYDSATRLRVRLVQDVQPEESCDTAEPTLVLNGEAPMTLECGPGTYSDPGAQAFDGCDNPLEVHAYNTGTDSSGPGPNLGAEGTYTVSYSAWDAAGRTVNASRTVYVDDRTAPALALKGSAHMTHTCNSPWVDPGVEATDACYGDLAHTVWRSGDVNGWAEGTYTVTYSLTDSGGNSATPVTRTVEVVDCPW